MKVKHLPFSQSMGLINYLRTVQKDPKHNLESKLKKPFDGMNFIEGIPILPGMTGNLPGAGACLPKGSPLIRDRSPSFFQNILRNIPGVQDYLVGMLPSPKVDVKALEGRYMWVLDTPSASNRYCPTTEFQVKADIEKSYGLTVQEKFRPNGEDSGEKVGFGYGIIHKDKTYIYIQDDPCPYQIVIMGPRNQRTGQYEYLVLSNWARYPIIGLARDIRHFYKHYKDEMENKLESAGLINDVTGNSNIRYVDWSKCKKATPLSYVQNVLTDLFG
ncbi:hypothetical protein WR25_16062 isoform D [Diploscapter pachys]|uniref:Lipocalin domain-containing protein n=1 Tax=Diploscapter pachys TaxID=2018661 RepID=A0A2A2KIK5_9BILA|nr:hypothetical protein WR25_16062 isoform D [Diploscapter pachys]